MENVCYSGGAKGADIVFGECAEKAGHTVIHWTFDKHNRATNSVYTLNQAFLNIADPHLIRANEVLKRTFPTDKEYVNNLLRRNYYQIIEAEKVYAVTALDDRGLPYGGTAWAIVMAVQKGIKDIYVFDTNREKWVTLSHTHVDIGGKIVGLIWYVITENTVPYPSGKYAGIGSRDLTERGRQAIEDLYK